VRADPRQLDLVVPETLPEALEALEHDPERRPLAGGTDLMVLHAMDRLPSRRLLGLWKLAELRGITVDERFVTLGALTTYTEIAAHPVLRAEFPALVAAALETGGLAIQNRGTLGGNVANASPAADSSPPLLAYAAELELAYSRGTRWLTYDTFHTAYKQTAMRPGELVSRFRLPRVASPRRHVFRKIGPRRAQAISKICLAACVELHESSVVGVRLAFGGVAATVVRAPLAEAALVRGDLAGARAALASELRPIDDLRSTARYRLRVAQNLLASVLQPADRTG
jgi:CO/xanthine dehydrogenase FAD-binding subunit